MGKKDDERGLDLHKWIHLNFGEIDASVEVEDGKLVVSIQRGWKCRDVIPEEWGGVPVEVRNTEDTAPAESVE